MADEPRKTLEERVSEWLKTEGYPLEFATASEFARNGFHAAQGLHVRDANTQALREIDIVASPPEQQASFTAVHIVECKWSAKPWIVFSSETSQLTESVCARKTIASELGEAALWLLSERRALPGGRILFDAPVRPGFSGRQCFANEKDVFYSAVQSVVSKARRFVLSITDDRFSDPFSFPIVSLIAFPLIVLAADLFEAYFDEGIQDVRITKVKSMRLHWRGDEGGTGPVNVDIVTQERLPTYLRRRAEACYALLNAMEQSRVLLSRCFDEKSLQAIRDSINVGNIEFLPALLRKIHFREVQVPRVQ